MYIMTMTGGGRKALILQEVKKASGGSAARIESL